MNSKSEHIEKTFLGITWSFATQVIVQFINFSSLIFLMRWIVPDDFGLYAMVLVCERFILIVRNAGLTNALIQKKVLDEYDRSSSFIFVVLMGVGLGVLFMASGPLLDGFYQQKGLGVIAFWLGIDSIINACGVVPKALLHRKLAFKQIFFVQLASTLISTTLALYLAFHGHGYMALVVKMVSWTAITVVGEYLFVDWIPKLLFRWNTVRSLLSFGVPNAANHAITHILRNVDDVFIGQVLGAEPLGFYNRSYAFLQLPINNITAVVARVMYASWSQIQDNRERIKKMYLQVAGMIATMSFPLMVILIVLADGFIPLLLGENWVPMVTTFRILAAIGMIQSVGSLVGILFMVFDRNVLMLKINVITTASTILIVLMTLYHFRTIEATAAGYSLASLLFIYPTFYFAGRLFDASFKEMIKPMIMPFVLALLAGGITWVMYMVLLVTWEEALKLVASATIGAICYILLTRQFNQVRWREFYEVYQKYVHRWRG